MLIPWDQEEILERWKFRKLSGVRVPVKVVLVVPKQNTTEEQREDQSCLFRREDYRNKDTTPKNYPDSSPGEDGFYSSETTLNRRMAPRSKLFFSARRYRDRCHNHENLFWVRIPVRKLCSLESKHERRMTPRWELFRRGDCRNKGQKPKMSCFRVPVKMDLRILSPMIFNDTFKIIKYMESFRAIKIYKKCNHLSHFSAVTLRTLLVFLYKSINTVKTHIFQKFLFHSILIPFYFRFLDCIIQRLSSYVCQISAS
jgi:hypothetical protein